MATYIQYFPILLVLLFPIVFYRVYLTSLKKKAEQIINSHTNEFSELYKDLNVWVKNFNVLEKANFIPSDPYQTNYDFYNCDLLLNENYLVVIGKTNLLGIKITLMPIFFQFGKANQILTQSRIVEVTNLIEKEADMEISFSDPAYKNEMILVLKRITPELKSKILTHFYKTIQP